MIWTGFLLGFLGSFHCLGMCGPIALAISSQDNSRFLTNKVIYNLGRTVTYSLLGVLVGALGLSLQLAGLQQWFSILTGAIIILMAFFYKQSERWVAGAAGFSDLAGKVKKGLGKYLKMGGRKAFFAGGLINGLLPCGMVYIALLASLALQDPLKGGIYMTAFGLGTIPLMLVVMLSGKLFSIRIRQRFLRAMPYFAMFIGILFILRGSGLGIHYVSPQLQQVVYGAQPTEMTMCE
jgi:sulfite exporter TauE/SafE